MPGRPKNSLDPLVLFHCCDKDVADSVLRREATLQPSENDYDWLGNGIYFWVDSPERALSWAKQRRSSPSVLGAYAYPGNCLNLTDYGVRRPRYSPATTKPGPPAATKPASQQIEKIDPRLKK
jgi:hypothetical protein